MAGNCKLATLLKKGKLCTKDREYNGLSLLLLERQIKLHLLLCYRVKLGVKSGGVKLGENILALLKCMDGPVLAFLKCMDGFILAFLNCTDVSILLSLKCMDGSVLAHLRFSIQSALT